MGSVERKTNAKARGENQRGVWPAGRHPEDVPKSKGRRIIRFNRLADTADKAVILINQLRQNIIYIRQKMMLTTMHSSETVA